MKDSIIETQIKEKSSSLEFEFEMDDLLDIDAKANLEDEEGYIDQVFEACGLDVNGEGDDWETNRRMVRILIRILENWGLDVDNPTFLGVITNWLKYELIAQEQAIEKSTKVTEEGTQATEESTKVTEEGTQATEESTKVTEESTKVTEEGTQATEESTKVTEEGTQATEESTKVTEEGTQATEESTKVTEESTKVTEEGTKVTEEGTQATEEGTQATEESTKVTEESTKVTEESTKVTEEGTQATEESTKVTEESTKVTEESTKVTEEGTQATEESTKVTEEGTQATEESTKVTEEGTQATEESTKVTEEGTQATEESTKVTEEGTQATEESTKVTEEGTQATEESTKVTEEGTQATEESTKVTEEGTQATEESTKVTEEGTQATEESTKVTEEGTQATEMKDSIIETQIKEKGSSLDFESEIVDLFNNEVTVNEESHFCSEQVDLFYKKHMDKYVIKDEEWDVWDVLDVWDVWDVWEAWKVLEADILETLIVDYSYYTNAYITQESLIINEYFTILIYLLFAILLAYLILGFSYLFVVQNPETEKMSAYECGFEPYEDARQKFDVKFYIVAMLFIIFDIETMYLIPWCVALPYINSVGYFVMVEFILELCVGFLYVWYIGGLEWD